MGTFHVGDRVVWTPVVSLAGPYQAVIDWIFPSGRIRINVQLNGPDFFVITTHRRLDRDKSGGVISRRKVWTH
jgi:hypothetical protein